MRCINADVLIGYDVVRWRGFKLNLSAGPTVAYISRTDLAYWEKGTFIGWATGEQLMQVYFPLYSRIIDLGGTVEINLDYRISDKVLVGVLFRANCYYESWNSFYDTGFKMGVNF